MSRYFFKIAYNGKDYFGWQRQPKHISVQQKIEECLSKIYSNKPIAIVGCGRTDTGVHANDYTFHADLESIEDTEQLIFKLNRMLPDSIAIFSIEKVSDELHARFSASRRTYRYYVHHIKDPFLADRSWYIPRDLDFDKMNQAAKDLIGKQDFTSLSKLHTDVKTNICDVTKAEWVVNSKNQVYFEISADRFLRNMVRATVGTLVDIGLDKIEPEELRKILDAKDRQEASNSAPGQGLFLWQVEY
jgi:tRNA pseudouridine38-40 synthase